MSRPRRARLAARAGERNRDELSRVGSGLRESRLRRRLTQRAAAALAGVSEATVRRIEGGASGSISLDSIQRLAVAVGRPLRLELARDTLGETADAAHLAIQELIIRIARQAGLVPAFELATRPSAPGRSADVALRDDQARVLLLVEAWNTIGDVGAAARSSDRKRAEAESLAVARWGERPHRVAGCWVVRATAVNRALVARYPETFSTRFPGSSAAWVRALAARGEPPAEPGLVWCDVGATHLLAWRRRGSPPELTGRPSSACRRAS